MSKSDDYILITESHNLGDGPILSGTKTNNEDEDTSLRALENQGISIIQKEASAAATVEPRDQFSRELMEEGGIEIIPSDEDPTSL